MFRFIRRWFYSRFVPIETYQRVYVELSRERRKARRYKSESDKLRRLYDERPHTLPQQARTNGLLAVLNRSTMRAAALGLDYDGEALEQVASELESGGPCWRSAMVLLDLHMDDVRKHIWKGGDT